MRVRRLCRSEGVRVLVKKRKLRRNGDATDPGERQVPVCPDHVWAFDLHVD